MSLKKKRHIWGVMRVGEHLTQVMKNVSSNITHPWDFCLTSWCVLQQGSIKLLVLYILLSVLYLCSLLKIIVKCLALLLH